MKKGIKRLEESIPGSKVRVKLVPEMKPIRQNHCFREPNRFARSETDPKKKNKKKVILR